MAITATAALLGTAILGAISGGIGASMAYENETAPSAVSPAPRMYYYVPAEQQPYTGAHQPFAYPRFYYNSHGEIVYPYPGR